jgi:uncharacterized 2Fe-2S/4Fe-4S cluster protein (DUF4445 family)
MSRVKPVDSVEVSVAQAGVIEIPTSTLSDYDGPYDSDFIINIYVTGSAGAYIQVSGSSQLGDARYVAPGAIGQYGPISIEDMPVLRFAGASGAWISFDPVVSGG